MIFSVFCDYKCVIVIINDYDITGWWLKPTALKNMSSSIDDESFPIYGNIKNVPNHQPDKLKSIEHL